MTAIAISASLFSAIKAVATSSVALGKRGAAVAIARAETALRVKAAIAEGATWDDLKVTIRRNYIVGYVAGGLKAEQVDAWLADTDASKAKPKSGEPTTLQLAYAAASVELSRVKDVAGLEKDASKTTQASKDKRAAINAAGKVSEDGDAPKADAPAPRNIIAPRGLSDVIEQLDAMARNVRDLQAAASAAHLLDGDSGMIVRDAFAAILAAFKVAHADKAPVIATETPKRSTRAARNVINGTVHASA